MQTELNQAVNATVSAFIEANPEATLTDVMRALEDAKTDAPAVFDAALPPATALARQMAEEGSTVAHAREVA